MNSVTVNSFHDIPGWTYINQLEQFKEVAKLLPANPRVLEIGCGYGRSTWAWLDALPATTEMFVLDNFGTPYEHIFDYDNSFKNLMKVNMHKVKEFQESDMNQEQIFFNNIPQHPNTHIIKHVWNMDSSHWVQHINDKQWDLVYIDEDHSFEKTISWLEYFQNTKYVCGDDYSSAWRGVIAAVDLYVTRYNRRANRNMFNSFFLIQNF
jgi:hypothetical protein